MKRRRTLAQVLGIVLAGAGLVAASGTTAHAASSPVAVALTFDDGNADTIPALDLLKSRGLTATLYLNSSRIGATNFLSRTQLKTYAGAGFEMAGHTLNHEDLTTLTLQQAHDNICADRSNLIALGFAPYDFAYPFGNDSPDIDAAARDCGYNSGRIISDLKSPSSCSRCAPAEPIPPVDPYAIRSVSSVRSTYTEASLEALVTNAENSGGGLMPFVFHHICDTCGGSSMSLADFTAFVTFLQADPNVSIRTMHNVIGGPLNPVPGSGDPNPTPDVDSVLVNGTKSHVVDGVNTTRLANQTIVYTAQAGPTTGTNAYGTEVSVVNNKATSVVTGVGNMAVPTGPAAQNFVLSGHGTSATWIKANIKVGDTVTLPDLGTPPPPPPPPVDHPTTSVTIAGQTRAVDGVNSTRLANQLIVYTPDAGASTGTNQYGFEAAVVNGVITQTVDGVGDMAIPANGYVLSGHGTARTFLRGAARVGATVTGQ